MNLPKRTRPQVLLVDDEPAVLAALRRALRGESFELLCASSGAEALRVLARTPVDALLSDRDMPGMSGNELLATVRVRYPACVRLMLTGRPTLDAALDAINRGEVHRFFVKPCDARLIAVGIQSALQEHEVLHAARAMLGELRRKNAVLEELERRNPGATHVELDDEGCVVLDDILGDANQLLEQIQQTLAPSRASDGEQRALNVPGPVEKDHDV